jgi:DNA-binding transcriptional MerR regulator
MRTVRQVSKASGVTVRALHHYDHIGLLSPKVGANGYRYYEQAEMLRLQHILFYRELGVPLSEIAQILDDANFDTRSALLDLRARVEDEIAKRRQLAATIDRTLALLDAGKAVVDNRMFEGVSAVKQREWEAYIVERFGPSGEAQLSEATRAIDALSSSAFIEYKAEIDEIHQGFVELIESGATPSSAAAQALTKRHHQWVCRSWRPDAVAYAELGRVYNEHADFRAMYDALHPRLADFLARAMSFHAHHRIKGTVQ